MSHPGSRLAVFVLTLALAAPTLAAELAGEQRWMGLQLPRVLGLYQFLHSHPELSGSEVNTARRLAEELKSVGAEVTSGVGRLGVVGVLRNGKGPTVLARADMDALPVTEATGLPFSSKATTDDGSGTRVGVMHACGHDVHMASLVGTDRWLADHKDQWSGTVVLIGQPAEEAAGGARRMLADGL